MKIELVLVSIEAEEPRHKLVFEMPGVPRTGDCVTISRPDQSGNSEFVVRRTYWSLDYPEAGSVHHAGESVAGMTNSVTIECEFVAGPYSFEEHKSVVASGLT